MSINQHASSAQWWPSQYLLDYSSPPDKFSLSSDNTNFDFNLNHSISIIEGGEDDHIQEEEYSEREIPKEPLFEKPLTPSDVGKLNRLVIPKQHAERCFPLNGDSGEKGSLLSFEDVEMGKCWRFRYSYWNSSQSYVLTKGWSRFVKEKRLDAGDVVLFSRHRADGGRMFIGWRRGGGGGWRGTAQTHAGPFQPNQTSTVVASGNTKTLRLFGVNLEYEPDNNGRSQPSGSPTFTSHGQIHHFTPYQQQQYYSYYYH